MICIAITVVTVDALNTSRLIKQATQQPQKTLIGKGFFIYLQLIKMFSTLLPDAALIPCKASFYPTSACALPIVEKNLQEYKSCTSVDSLSPNAS